MVLSTSESNQSESEQYTSEEEENHSAATANIKNQTNIIANNSSPDEEDEVDSDDSKDGTHEDDRQRKVMENKRKKNNKTDKPVADVTTKEVEQKAVTKSRVQAKRKPAAENTTKKAAAATVAPRRMRNVAAIAKPAELDAVLSTSGITGAKRASLVAKVVKKTPAKMPVPKSLTTKELIIQAIAANKDYRNGASIHFIKKHMTDRYKISNQRMKQVIKLLRVAGTEGWLLQLSGIGASSGSHFKLPDDIKNVMKKEMKEKMKEPNMMGKRKEKKPKLVEAVKIKVAPKRKAEKKVVDKEIPAKKKKVSEKKAPKKKAAAKTSKKKATA